MVPPSRAAPRCLRRSCRRGAGHRPQRRLGRALLGPDWRRLRRGPRRLRGPSARPPRSSGTLAMARA
eukprot:654009-Alexandrium_andersonii.AAC.1